MSHRDLQQLLRRVDESGSERFVFWPGPHPNASERGLLACGLGMRWPTVGVDREEPGPLDHRSAPMA